VLHHQKKQVNQAEKVSHCPDHVIILLQSRWMGVDRELVEMKKATILKNRRPEGKERRQSEGFASEHADRVRSLDQATS
jgi:hypothetical protein